MSKLLQIKTGIFADNSQSSRLADDFVQKWKAGHPDAEVIVRDFTTNPVPHLTAERFGAVLTPAEERNEAQQAIAAEADQLIEELRGADIVVLGLPMYNFGIPSQLKAWFDHVARAGVTFKYTENGPVGLLGNKKIYVLAARGGMYQGTPKDTQTGHVKDFFNLLGITDMEFVYAEGLNLGDEPREQALSEARRQIERLAA